MNEFEKRMSALRLQFKAEQRQISKDSYRKISRLNTAIGQTHIAEARDVLREEKHREYEAMRKSHELNRTCYLQQLEMIADEERLSRQKNPSKSQLRRMMAQLYRYAEANGSKVLSFSFGENHHADISFD